MKLSARERNFVIHFTGQDRPWRRYFSLRGAYHAASSRLARNHPAAPKNKHHNYTVLHKQSVGLGNDLL